MAADLGIGKSKLGHWVSQYRTSDLQYLYCRPISSGRTSTYAWIFKPVCQRRRTDLKILVHIREHFVLSNSIYDRPRMAMEVKKAKFDIGKCRVRWLIKLNGIRPVRTRRHRVTSPV